MSIPNGAWALASTLIVCATIILMPDHKKIDHVHHKVDDFEKKIDKILAELDKSSEYIRKMR
jgi:tetrahydromethanopterin S-methyltransferase subunit G